MKHKWSNKLSKQKQFAKCLRCNCIKETHFPLGIIYFMGNSKKFITHAPPCLILNKDAVLDD